EQADVVRVAEQLVEERLGLVERAAAEREVLGRPEAAQPERALRRRRCVAKEQASADAETALHRSPRRAHPHGVCALEAVPGKEQRHRVELLRADDADVCANPRVPCFELDVLAYRVARRTQLLD